MKIIQYNQRTTICFSLDELTRLLLSKNFAQILSLAIKNFNNLEQAKEKVIALGKNDVNSKNYELWFGILSLYEEFNRNCDFCFYVNNNFDPKTSKINSLADLEYFRQGEDPPDIIVRQNNSFGEFELKRYREDLNEKQLFNFVDKKILKHYADQFNFVILLQPKPTSIISLNIFKHVHQEIKKHITTGRNIGKIAFTFNNDGKEICFITVFPELLISKKPFIKGSKQMALYLGATSDK